MKVFISWSGNRSKSVAEYLASWLPLLMQAVEPWVSTAIDKGTRGNEEIAKALESTGVGLLCLTRENLDAPWIHYEAGALAKSHDRVWTLLLGISHADVSPPLSQFQHALATRDDVYQLVASINRRLDGFGQRPVPETSLAKLFDRFWPDLEEKIHEVEATAGSSGPVRSDRQLIEEVLELVRYLRAGSVTIHKYSNLTFGQTFEFSTAKLFEGMRERLGESIPDERLGSLHLQGAATEAERLANTLMERRLTTSVRVETLMAGYPTLTFAAADGVTPKEVVEAADRYGVEIVMSIPATERQKAETLALQRSASKRKDGKATKSRAKKRRPTS